MKRPSDFNAGHFLSGLAFVLLASPGATAASVEWIRQFGREFFDSADSVSADGLGNVYVGGSTPEQDGPYADIRDAYVSKFDSAGNQLWLKPVPSFGDDYGTGISYDRGNVYIAGFTLGRINGGTNLGDFDAFIGKYGADGNLVWTRQFGTRDRDYTGGVSADGLGNVYISGVTNGSFGGQLTSSTDAFVAKYDEDGNEAWVRQLGTSQEEGSNAVAADGLGNVYVTGYTTGSLGETNAGMRDAFLTKYDADGDLIWTRQFGTKYNDEGFGISTDNLGNIFISGEINAGQGGADDFYNLGDAFVTKYDAAGNQVWTRQLGTNKKDAGHGIAADGRGGAYVIGSVFGQVGARDAGNIDAFVGKYDSAGALVWVEQVGGSSWDAGLGVTSDDLGNVFASGYTSSNLGGPNSGASDAFLVRISDVPEPTVLALSAVGAAAFVRRRLATEG